MSLVNMVLEEILEKQKYMDENTGAIYRIQHASESSHKHKYFIWKNNRQFMLTPTMRSKKMAITTAAVAIASNMLQ